MCRDLGFQSKGRIRLLPVTPSIHNNLFSNVSIRLCCLGCEACNGLGRCFVYNCYMCHENSQKIQIRSKVEQLKVWQSFTW